MFWARFLLLLGLYFAATVTAPYARLLEPYLRLQTRLAAATLARIEPESRAEGTTLASARFAVRVDRGCDGLDAAAIFASGVLAFPAAWTARGIGLAAGLLLIGLMNLVRILSLFLTGIHFPAAFETLHHEFWQAFFVFFALGLWWFWARGVLQRAQPAASGA